MYECRNINNIAAYQTPSHSVEWDKHFGKVRLSFAIIFQYIVYARHSLYCMCCAAIQLTWRTPSYTLHGFNCVPIYAYRNDTIICWLSSTFTNVLSWMYYGWLAWFFLLSSSRLMWSKIGFKWSFFEKWVIF